MGKGRSRRRKQRKRRSKQDAIALPPPQDPPVMLASEASSEAAAIPLGASDEPLVENPEHAAEEVPQNRQARRKAKRQQAKAAKRSAKIEVLEPVLDTPVAQQFFDGDIPEELTSEVEPKHGAPTSAPPQERQTPLPTDSPAITLEDTMSAWMEQYLIVDRPFDGKGAGGELDQSLPSPVAKPEPQEPPKLLTAKPTPPDAPLLNVAVLSDLLVQPTEEYEIAPQIAPEGLAIDPSAAPAEVFAPIRETEQDKESSTPPEEALAPIPRQRALSDPNAKAFTKLRLWIMRMFEAKTPAPTHNGKGLPIDQLTELQSDLTAIQERVDRMISSARG